MATIAVHRPRPPHRAAARTPARVAGRALRSALTATVRAPDAPEAARCGVRIGLRHVSGR